MSNTPRTDAVRMNRSSEHPRGLVPAEKMEELERELNNMSDQCDVCKLTPPFDRPTPRLVKEWNRIASCENPEFEKGLHAFAQQLERELANMADQRDAALRTLERMKKNHERELAEAKKQAEAWEKEAWSADELATQRDQELAEAEAKIKHLESKFTKLDKPMYSGNPMLDSVLETSNPEFDAWVKSQSPTYWARYDLGATRIGWEAAMTKQKGTTP